MPYKKRYRRKRKARPSRWKTYGAAGKQLAKDVSMLKNLINVEFKYLDTSMTLTPNTTGSISYLNLVPQGDGINSRDGAQFRNKSVELRFTLVNSATLSSFSNHRIIFGIHKNVNSTTLTPADVLQNLTPTSPRNYDNQKNVIVLKEWIESSVQGQENHSTIYKYHTDLDLITRYQSTATAAALTGMEQGGLFIMTIGDQATNTPTFQATARIRFVDN